MVELKTDGELDAMREAGRVVGQALAAVRKHAGVGTTLRELDEIAYQTIVDAGARPTFLHYQPGFSDSPFPGTICSSVNDVIVHGIPGDYALADGDLVGIDCGAKLNGWTGDAAITFPVGTPREDDLELVRATQAALDAGIAASTVGNKLGDVGHAIETVARSGGYGMPPDFGGHGIGREMHEEPMVYNVGRPGRGMRLRKGLAIAIEPMLIAGGRDAYGIDDDGWSLRTTDGSRAAHIEHSVAITDDGPRILTLP